MSKQNTFPTSIFLRYSWTSGYMSIVLSKYAAMLQQALGINGYSPVSPAMYIVHIVSYI